VWSLAGTGLILGYMLVVAAIKIASHKAPAHEAESEHTALLVAEKKFEYQALSFRADSNESDH
jgi:hypothetical protein